MKVVDWVDWNCNLPEVEGEEETQAAIEALIEHIRENNNPISGMEHQHEPGGVPLFDNGKVLTCSQRYWGGIMFDAMNPGVYDPMGYCEWAWMRPGESMWQAKEDSDEPVAETK